MRALQVTEWNHDPELREVAEPEPGPGEVVLDVAGAGACHSDLHLLYEFPAGLMPWTLPFTLGHEVAGRVARLGAGVTGFEVGEPVVVHGPWGCGHCHRCREGQENYCVHSQELEVAGPGLGLDGGMADQLLIRSARHLLPIGDLDPVQAAPLADAGLTPYHAVRRSRHLLLPGSHALVIGAGGLGNLGVQILAATSPAEVTVVDQRPDAVERATAVGASHGVVAGDDAAAEIQEITGGRGADLVIDFVGSDATLALAVASVRTLGHLTMVGIAGGALPFSFLGVPYEASVATTYWGSFTELMEVVALARAGHLRVEVEQYPLDRAPEAYQALRAGELQGRAVVVP
jgi:propanol-preferring alcohol dehydrogenase